MEVAGGGDVFHVDQHAQLPRGLRQPGGDVFGQVSDPQHVQLGQSGGIGQGGAQVVTGLRGQLGFGSVGV